jgi:hypothetical protein
VIVLQIGAHHIHVADSVVYSFQNLLPPFAKLQSFNGVILGAFARWYFYFHQLVGYVLAGFLTAGLAGLTQKFNSPISLLNEIRPPRISRNQAPLRGEEKRLCHASEAFKNVWRLPFIGFHPLRSMIASNGMFNAHESCDQIECTMETPSCALSMCTSIR